MVEVSFIIPTLNSGSVLEKCLKSIKSQNINSKDYEIIIADGGSIDDTLKIAKKYKAIIISNPLKTAEAGKAIGVKKSQGKYIVLIDSDNILPNSDWVNFSLKPFKNDSQIIGTEPISFTYRPHSGLMERYSALIGANDPYAYITGVYDRFSYLNNKWTRLHLKTQDLNDYIKIFLKPNDLIPTIGANGTIFKSTFIKKYFLSDYLFDIDLISYVLKKTNKELCFAKTKTSIIHTFCESSFKKFFRKQKRRLIDYYQYQPLRQYDWSQTNHLALIKFIFYNILILPPIIDSIRGFLKKPDSAWFIHPFACATTLFVYAYVTVEHKIGILKPLNRAKWQQ